MQPLPVNPFEPSVWSEQKVLIDYTVTDGLNKYTVPYDLIDKNVSVRITRDTIEVFYEGNQVAAHLRERRRLQEPIAERAHMPENHRQYLNYTKDDFLSWAKTMGPNTEKTVRFFLESGKAPEQGFKSCVSLKKYANQYKKERIEEACRQILTFSGQPSIRGISILLKSPVTARVAPAATSPTLKTYRRSGGFTRGAEQFREGGDEQ